MRLLGIDTSSAVTAALLVTPAGSGPVLDQEYVAQISHDDPRHHAELLTPSIAQLFVDSTHVSDISACDGIVIGRGPGPFTGLRVGIVTARTLALAHELPIHGVCSLDALAREAFINVDDVTESLTVLATIDARRKELYWCLYQPELDTHGRWTGDVVQKGDVSVTTPGDVPSADIVVGRGPRLYPDTFLDANVVSHIIDPSAIALCELAAIRLTSGSRDMSSTEPMYLRRPDVAPPTPRKRAS